MESGVVFELLKMSLLDGDNQPEEKSTSHCLVEQTEQWNLTPA